MNELNVVDYKTFDILDYSQFNKNYMIDKLIRVLLFRPIKIGYKKSH